MQSTKLSTASQNRTPRVWGNLPMRMKVLYVSSMRRAGFWLAEAFASDCAAEVLLQEAAGVSAAVMKLRDEEFDAVLITHDPGSLDALDLVEGLRAGGNEEPMVILGSQPSSDLTAIAFEVGADAYCCVSEATTRSLLWTIARAIERLQLIRENRRLNQAEQQRLQHERCEADRLLAEQRTLIAELETLRDNPAAEVLSSANGLGAIADCGISFESVSNGRQIGSRSARSSTELPQPLISHYRELLRAYVVMGAGNLVDELNSLGGMLVEAGVSAQLTMQLHVQVLEELIASLGNRSARHVMNRADLLVLEVMAHLADGYRRRYHDLG